jgi:WD repeat-containing protein 26
MDSSASSQTMTQPFGTETQESELRRLVSQFLADRGLRAVAWEGESEGNSSISPFEEGETEVSGAEVFAQAVARGEWEAAEACLDAASEEEGAQAAWIKPDFAPSVRFELRVAHYVELLTTESAGAEELPTTSALELLRTRLTPLATELKTQSSAEVRLRSLSALLLAASPADVLQQVGCSSLTVQDRRKRVLHDIRRRFLVDGVLLPDRRLESLVEQALLAQVGSCPFHNVQSEGDANSSQGGNPMTEGLSLLTDHACGRGSLPSVEAHVLSDAHSDEVWCCRFSPDGKLLASAGKDTVVTVFELVGIDELPHTQFDVRVRCTLAGHSKAVSLVSFSPDGRYLLTGSSDHKVKVWDVTEATTEAESVVPGGRCLLTVSAHTANVTSVAWFPDSVRFATGGQDKMVFTHRLTLGESPDRPVQGASLVDSWKTGRVNDLSVTDDGRFVVVACQDKKVRICDVATGQGEELEEISEAESITSLAVSGGIESSSSGRTLPPVENSAFLWNEGDGTPPSGAHRDSGRRHVLLNLANHEIHCWDLESKTLVQSFRGLKQSRFVIRSCFGGVNSSYVASGSEDSLVYIWHRSNGKLALSLPGHSGTVNDVSWNPRFVGVLASASDDGTVRIWTSVV